MIRGKTAIILDSFGILISRKDRENHLHPSLPFLREAQIRQESLDRIAVDRGAIQRSERSELRSNSVQQEVASEAKPLPLSPKAKYVRSTDSSPKNPLCPSPPQDPNQFHNQDLSPILPPSSTNNQCVGRLSASLQAAIDWPVGSANHPISAADSINQPPIPTNPV